MHKNLGLRGGDFVSEKLPDKIIDIDVIRANWNFRKNALARIEHLY